MDQVLFYLFKVGKPKLEVDLTQVRTAGKWQNRGPNPGA